MLSIAALATGVTPATAAPSYVLSGTFGEFAAVSGVAVDESNGNVFVSDSGANVVKVFGPDGGTPTGVAAPYTIEGFSFSNEPSGVAVDNSPTSASQGALYVADVRNNAVKKFELNPTTEEYELKTELSPSPGFGEPLGVAVDGRGRVYVADYGSESVIVFDDAGAEIGRINTSAFFHPSSVAIDSRGDVFVQGYGLGSSVYKWEANSSGEVEATTVGTQVVASGATGVAVDPLTDALFVAMGDHVELYDAITGSKELEIGEGALGTTERIAVNSGSSRVYVADRTLGEIAIFEPEPPPAPPVVVGQSTTSITADEAILRASIRPERAETTYRFEYGTDTTYGQSVPIPDRVAGGGNTTVSVQQAISGLLPSTTYHYRVVASNALGSDEGEDRIFTTYGAATPGLPDDRAYELVTPGNAGAVVPSAGLLAGSQGRDCFDTFLATENGDRVVFATGGGALQGLTTNGFLDLYESIRGPQGWSTVSRSASGTQSTRPAGGLCVSADHEFSTLLTDEAPFDEGTLPVEGKSTSYVRQADGSFVLVGQGSLGVDPEANVRWLAGGGEHVIFTTRQKQLEPEAPLTAGPGRGPEPALNPTVNAIYDRTPSGLRVVSLLPSGLAPDPSTESTAYLGTSVDGTAVVFEVEEEVEGTSTLYERRDNAITLPIATGALPASYVFAGVSRDGSKVVYVESDEPQPEVVNHQVGTIFVFDAAAGTSTEISGGNGATVINVSEDGSHVYFSSPTVIPGTGTNELGQGPEPGELNLYVWDEASEDVRFVALLDPDDFNASDEANLSKWTTAAVAPQQSGLSGRANDPSRTTPLGSVFVFESRANVTGYDSEGHAEIYRYDDGSGDLSCVSCPPAGVEATSDAALQPNVPFSPVNSIAHIQNVTDDGSKVFFQTKDALRPEDANGTYDVYEWKNGETFLISSGQSGLPSFLYAMTPTGRDVFFSTAERLVPQDESTVQSIYDAREGGGFPSPPVAPSPCQGDACQGSPGAVPSLPGASTNTFQGPRDPRPRHHRKHKKKRHKHKQHRKHAKSQPGRANHNRGGVK